MSHLPYIIIAQLGMKILDKSEIKQKYICQCGMSGQPKDKWGICKQRVLANAK